MKGYWKELAGLLKNRVFVVCLVLLVVIAYGYGAMNTAISIDDMETDRYVGSGMEMLRAGRFGMWFWHVIQGGWNNAPSMDILAVLIMILCACSCCVLFKKVSREQIGMPALTVFACMLITYPLIVDIWEYTGANVSIFASFLCATWAVVLMYGQIHEGKWSKRWRVVLAALLMMLVCASYESVVAVYIFLVCAVLALQVVYGEDKEKKTKELIRQGLLYAAVLLVGLVLRLVVHRITLAVLGLEPIINGRTEIMWMEYPVRTTVNRLVFEFAWNYGLNGVVYYPILLLLLSVAVLVFLGIVACRKHGAVLLIPGAGMLLSLVALSLVQGTYAAYRSCQVFAILCAFVAMLVVHSLPNRKWIRVGALVLCGWLCLYQANYVNYFLELNFRRSQQEAQVVQQIGVDLQRDTDSDKPVIFVGKYILSAGIIEDGSLPEDSVRWQAYKKIGSVACALGGGDPDSKIWRRILPETNVQSVINWSVTAFEQSSMEKLFAYYGYEIDIADFNAVYETAAAYAEETNMPAYPREGYIEDVGEYIIVNLG